MINIKNRRPEESLQHVVPDPNDFRQVANDLCKEALDDARIKLHPLLQSVELDRLDRRCEFLQAFKFALEQRIAQQLASWQPDVQAVFKFDGPLTQKKGCWDSTIHLLVMVSQPSNTMQALGQMLDRNLVKRLKQLSWSRFRKSQSIVDIQQVTPNEVRLGLSYGAMFYSVYTAPVKVWPQDGLA